MTLERECRARKNPNYDGACFHAQQYAEKYLKAQLCEYGASFVKTHDLVALLEQVLAIAPLWESFREDLAYLSDFAISFRYPGESANRESALEARHRCRQLSCNYGTVAFTRQPGILRILLRRSTHPMPESTLDPIGSNTFFPLETRPCPARRSAPNVV